MEQIIIEAIKKGIAIYAAHTNLDNIVLGVNGMIAKKLGLVVPTILQPKNKMLRRLITFGPIDQAEKIRKAIFDAGAGQIGKSTAPTAQQEARELAAWLRRYSR